MQPPVNGTDERLDALLDELRALRHAIEQAQRPPTPPAGLIKLSEPAKRGRPAKGR